MNLLNVVYILIIINLGVIAIGLVLLILIYKRWFTPDSPEITRAKTQSSVIIHDALKEANKVLGQAQIEGLRVVSKEKLKGRELEEKFTKALEGLSVELTKELGRSIDSAEKDYEHFLKTLEATIRKTASANQELIIAQTGRITAQTQEHLTQLVEQTREQTQQVLETELKDAKQMIEAYRTKRLQVIDDNIADILDEVLREVLSIGLSSKDHMQLVYKALQKAKNDNVLK